MPDPPLVESAPSVLSLTPTEASTLRSIGRRLVSTKSFWRAEVDDPTSLDDELSAKSVIRCTDLGNGRYEVTVVDNVGIVGLGERQLIVEPKIPSRHFRYLLDRSETFPRLSTEQASAQSDRSLWELVAHWYMGALEAALRGGLLADYHEHHAILVAARGTIRPVETARLYYQGNLSLSCDFEEFGADTPLNRMLKAAALAIAQTPALDDLLRRRARRSLVRLEDVGPLRHSDWRVSTDRRTRSYTAALLLARHVLAATGRTIHAGSDAAWTFLIRTPELVEEGIRRILRDGLAGVTTVEKKGWQLVGSKLTLNPDLLFGTTAVGDVKYKLAAGDWNRPDLYQITTFATDRRVTTAALFAFSSGTSPVGLPRLTVGPIALRALLWDAFPDADPARSAERLVADTTQWLTGAPGVGLDHPS